MLKFSIPLLLILSANALAETVHQPDETEEVFRCDFEEGVDTNYDLWPDDWTRRSGRGYPKYVKVEITDIGEPGGQGKRCLRMELDGGAVSLYSPFIPISSRFSYTLKGLLKTSGLVHDRASMEVTFYDENRKEIESFRSADYKNLTDWREVLIGPIAPGNEQVRWAVISLHLTPTDRADLVGSASFDEITFGRLPRMSLSTNSDHNIYTPQDTVKITCQLSGFKGSEPQLRFELRDVEGNVESSHVVKLEAIGKSATVGAANQAKLNSSEGQDDGSLGASSWEPILPNWTAPIYRIVPWNHVFF
jgi:hypothetical protein